MKVDFRVGGSEHHTFTLKEDGLDRADRREEGTADVTDGRAVSSQGRETGSGRGG
jgi:hypothetical protein